MELNTVISIDHLHYCNEDLGETAEDGSVWNTGQRNILWWYTEVGIIDLQQPQLSSFEQCIPQTSDGFPIDFTFNKTS